MFYAHSISSKSNDDLKLNEYLPFNHVQEAIRSDRNYQLTSSELRRHRQSRRPANRLLALRLLVSTGVLALATMASGRAQAQEAVVSACSGVSLPRSVVTDIAGDILVPVLTPVQNTLGALTFGTVDLGLTGALANAAAGAPITLGAVDVNGNAVNVLATPQCVAQADAYQLATPAGLSLGGGRITGLGTGGLYASAAEGDAIASGNAANTGVGATGAVALGAGASVTATGALGSVALGQNSAATGATLGNAAYLVGGTAAAEVNIGDRRLTGLAAGSADTDAVDVAQLKAATLGLTPVDALSFDTTLGAYSALHGGVTTRITNVAPGTIAAGSTDAVNGAQLSATNDAVSANTTTITTLNTSVGALQADALLFDPATNAYNAARGGAPTTITNVAAAALNATSTDAVNGAQLYAANQTVANLTTSVANGTADPLAVRYADATKATLALGGATGTVVTNVAAGALTTTSTDAVNGSQLAATNQSVANLGASVASGLGGGSTVNADGSVSAPAYQLTTVAAGGVAATTTYTDVGSALTGLGNSIANVNTRIDTIDTISDRAVTYDGATGSPRDTITLAGTTGTRITNLTAGAVNATSTDAVDGAQLYAVGQQVAANTTNIATLTTNVTSLQNGTAGYFQVNNTAGNPAPVASGTNAVAGGGGAVSSGGNAVALGTAATASGANSVALGAGSVADRDNSVSVGTATDTRQITNVAAGVSATDAVNVGQLASGLNQTLTQANAYTDARLAQVGFDLTTLRKDANGGTAAAMALATIPQAYGPGMGMVGGGISTWGGEEAFAIGVSKATASGGVVIKAGATINTRGQGGGAAGLGFAF